MEENLNKELIKKIEEQTEEYKKMRKSIEKLYEEWIKYMKMQENEYI